MASITSTDLSTILPKVHDLSDIELALLLSLITHDHPILTTPASHIDTLTRELSLIAPRTFHLTHAIVNCTPSTTLDDFASALLIPSSSSLKKPGRPDYFAPRPLRPSRRSTSPPSSGQIANCILATNLDLAPRAVQIQALELLRTRRIFTRTTVQTAPKRFVFIPVLQADAPGNGPQLTSHLNDFFALAHWHDPEDGYVNVEDEDEDEDECVERNPVDSVVRREHGDSSTALISEDDINHLAQLSQQVEIDIDVKRYQMNIVSFLRMHRAVQDGITPAATKHFEKLMRCLAPIHTLDYVTPALVGVAARKTYLHRIRITTPENERSMQWGSSLDAVTALLNDMGPEQVINDVLSMVTAPI